jgi:fido (protein-threonine AMPylation protein)
MAVYAAKFGHCQVGAPVEYRAKAPFRLEIAAPLDFAVRTERVYAQDRELDRAVMTVQALEQLLLEDVAAGRGPAGAFAEDDLSARRRGRTPATKNPSPSLGPMRRQFLLNALRIAEEPARFRPPWTDAVVEEVHAVLHADIGPAGTAGVFRRTPYVSEGPRGEVLYSACPPEKIRSELQSLLSWVDRAGPTLMPVIPATVLLAGLHSIRPFPYGNMTVARTMAILYLRYNGLLNAELAPIATAALATPDTLFRLLLWTESTGSYTELVDFTLDAVATGYAQGVRRWLGPGSGSAGFEEVALRLLSKARRTPGWFSARDIAGWVGGRSDPTVLRHLNRLVGAGTLETLGLTRAKRYRFVSPRALLPELRRRIEGAELFHTKPVRTRRALAT